MAHIKIHMDNAVDALYHIELLTDSKHYKPGVGFICKAEDVGLESFVQCLEKDSRFCAYSIPYAGSHYCTSPARIHLAKTVKT